MKQRLILPSYVVLCCALLPIWSWWSNAASRKSAVPRRLVLVLDGVPHQTIAALKAEGRFSQFKEPARMVSTFPSLTNPAMIEILHHEDSPGYEDHFYDREVNRLRGTIQDRLQGGKFIQGTFRETFDYHAPAFKGALGYVAAPIGTITLAHLDLAAFRKAFRQSDAPLFVAYIGETDSLAHLGGEEPLKAFLRTVDRTLEELLDDARQSGGELTIEMFSDHGNNYAAYKHVKLNDALQAAGFVTEKSIVSAQSVVLPKHGLVGSSLLFTQPQNRARVAETAAQTEGVDFAVFPLDDNTLELVGKRGRARVLRRAEQYKYEALEGDLLALQGITGELKTQGLLDAAGFAARDVWWNATLAHDYVDPLRRLFDGFHAHVKNRADVIVSYENGYLVGSPLLSVFAEMRATHGNLLRGETEGFAMSTRLGRQELGEAVPGDKLNQLFGLDQRAKAGHYLSGVGHCEIGPALVAELISSAQ